MTLFTLLAYALAGCLIGISLAFLIVGAVELRSALRMRRENRQRRVRL